VLVARVVTVRLSLTVGYVSLSLDGHVQLPPAACPGSDLCLSCSSDAGRRLSVADISRRYITHSGLTTRSVAVHANVLLTAGVLIILELLIHNTRNS